MCAANPLSRRWFLGAESWVLSFGFSAGFVIANPKLKTQNPKPTCSFTPFISG